MDRKWLHAQLNLAWKVVTHYVAKLWPWSQRSGRCTTCGACDAACPILRTDRDFMGPMAFIVAGARAAPHLDDVNDTLAILTQPACAECTQCERACPEAIPILAVAHALTAQRAVIHEARAGRIPIRSADLKRADLKQLPASSSSSASLSLSASSSSKGHR